MLVLSPAKDGSPGNMRSAWSCAKEVKSRYRTTDHGSGISDHLLVLFLKVEVVCVPGERLSY